MQTFTPVQQYRIMLESDFIGPVFDAKDLAQIRPLQDEQVEMLSEISPEAESLLPEPLAIQVNQRLQKGFLFSQKSSQLASGGVQVVFHHAQKTPALPESIWESFPENPSFLFPLGDLSLLKRNLLITKDLNLALCASKPVAYLGQESFDLCFTSTRLIEKVRQGLVVIVKSRFFQEPPEFSSSLAIRQSQPVRTENRALSGSYSDQRVSSKKVFISGSRWQKKLSNSMVESLQRICSQGIQILIGDCNTGVDALCADWLKSVSYPHVHLYTSMPNPRIKPASIWELIRAENPQNLVGRQMQTLKDQAMAKEADWGMAIFNPVQKNRFGRYELSKGTLRNVIQMLLDRKMVKFFYVIGEDVKHKTLKTLEDLETVLASYQSEQPFIGKGSWGQEYFPEKGKFIQNEYQKLVAAEKAKDKNEDQKLEEMNIIESTFPVQPHKNHSDTT